MNKIYSGRKYLQNLYVIQNLHSEYIKKPQNSIRRQSINKKGKIFECRGTWVAQ